MYLLKLT